MLDNSWFRHNTNRSAPTFANINMLGKCNANCYFCLGKDIPEYLSGRRDNLIDWREWPRFNEFLIGLHSAGIKKIYLTGQNTDALLLKDLGGLIAYVQGRGFDIGLRTNGILALKHLQEINSARLETGYSIHSMVDTVNQKIMGCNVPNWDQIISQTERCRVALVLCRYNVDEFYRLVEYIGSFANVDHIQIRRISSETRREEMLPDIEIYEHIHNEVADKFPLVREFYGAPIYNIHGVEVTFWRTVKTSIGSVNYFTDGTISNDYFVVKGYTDSIGKSLNVVY